MPTVFILNDSGHEYKDAERFGPVVACTTGTLDRWDTNAMYLSLLRDLRDSHPDDYIIVDTLTSLCCIASGIMAVLHGQVNLLLWDKDHYVARSVHFPNNEE